MKLKTEKAVYMYTNLLFYGWSKSNIMVISG